MVISHKTCELHAVFAQEQRLFYPGYFRSVITYFSLKNSRCRSRCAKSSMRHLWEVGSNVELIFLRLLAIYNVIHIYQRVSLLTGEVRPLSVISKWWRCRRKARQWAFLLVIIEPLISELSVLSVLKRWSASVIRSFSYRARVHSIVWFVWVTFRFIGVGTCSCGGAGGRCNPRNLDKNIFWVAGSKIWATDSVQEGG